MVSRKTQLAWMAGGGVLCMITIIISCKMREGERATAGDDSPPVAVVPLPPDRGALLPPIRHAETKPMPPARDGGEFVPPMPPTPPTPTFQPVSALLPAVQPAPEPTVTTIPPVTVPPQPPTDVDATKLRTVPAIPDAKPATLTPVYVNPPPPPVDQPAVAPPSVQLKGPPASADPVSAPPTAATTVNEPGEPPLAPLPGPVVLYHVRQGGELLHDIARRTLGSPERWMELVRLNPELSSDTRLSTGTVVRLPADACVPTEELEAVKPLPGLKPLAAKATKPKVVLPLTGTFPCNLDDSRALLLPKTIRDQLGATETMMISPGTDQCLWLTTPTHLERMAQHMEQSQAKEVDVHAFKRLYFAQTEKVSLSSEGRVVISDRLATFAGLRQEVVLVGIDDHFELWDVTRWKDFTQKKSAAARANIAAEQE